MIYGNYLRDKYNNTAVKLADAEGVPCIMEYSKGKNMRNYEIYGNSVQSKNLLPYPYYNTTQTKYGITFTDNGDGTITLNGTCTETGSKYVTDFILFSKSEFNAGTYTISGCPAGGSTYKYRLFVTVYDSDENPKYYNEYGDSNGTSFTVTDNCTVHITIRIGGEIGTVDNLVFKPQLELGSTATEWQSPVISPENPVEIQSMGNLTTKNLLPYPYYDTTKTINGITFTDNGDGSVTVNGTATDKALFYLMSDNNPLTLEAGKYMLSGCPAGGSLETYYIGGFNTLETGVGEKLSLASSKSSGLYIKVVSGTTVSNLVFKPQIELGLTATEYEPYHKYKIPIMVAGKNLIPYSYTYKTTTINGVTFTNNGDGSITIDGTATANAVFYLTDTSSKYTLDKCGLKIGDSYTISKTLISGDSIANIYFVANYYNTSDTMKQGALATSSNTATSTIQSDFKSWGIYLLVAKDKTVNNTTIKIQLEKGSTATAYEPYIPPVTTNIYLNEPLRKVGDYADYIDFKNQKVVRNIKEVTFDGTENWYYRDTDNLIYLRINNLASSVYCYSTHFLSEATKDTISPYFRPVAGILRLYQRNGNVLYSSADEFKTFLANQNTAGTPLIVDYILSTPIEENISLPALKTFKGTTVMSVDTSVLPSNIKTKYVRL